MNAKITLFALLSATQALIPTDFKEYPSKGNLNDDTTIKIAASNEFGNCLCDLTKGGCDESCCCDPDCPADIVAIWKASPEGCEDK